MRWKSGTNTIGQWASLRGPGSKQLVPGLQDGNVPFARVLFSLVCEYFRLPSESLAKASATANLLATKVLNKITYRPSLTEGNLRENL